MANWLVLTPWLIFGAVLAVICYRMLRSRTSAHRHRRDAGDERQARGRDR